MDLFTIRERKVVYFGRMITRENMHRQLLEVQFNGKRSRGRPKAKWMENIMEWCKTTSYSELVRGAQNRQG